MFKKALILLLLTSCAEPLTQEQNDLASKQAEWWADARQGASKGCIHPLTDRDYSKCLVLIPNGDFLERWELHCDERRCVSSELQSCESRK
jgi:hypothetical protein